MILKYSNIFLCVHHESKSDLELFQIGCPLLSNHSFLFCALRKIIVSGQIYSYTDIQMHSPTN